MSSPSSAVTPIRERVEVGSILAPKPSGPDLVLLSGQLVGEEQVKVEELKRVHFWTLNSALLKFSQHLIYLDNGKNLVA